MNIEKIYKENYDLLYNYLLWRVYNKHALEDILSETFIKFIEVRNAGDKINNAKAWLFKVAYRKTIDYFRNDKKGAELIEDSLAEDVIGLLEKESQLDEFLRLRKAMRKLPPVQYKSVELKFFGELKNREIAEILEVSEKTVSSNLKNAYLKLESQLLKG